MQDSKFSALTEQEIIRLAKDDPLAVAFLYREHYAAIYAYVNRRIGKTHDTHDIVADVFLVMVRYLPRFRWTGAPFRCWLLSLTTTQINRWIRKRRFLNLWRSIDLYDPPSTNVADQDRRLEPMQIALLELSLPFQTALSLHYFEDLPVEAIAIIMRCPQGTVKSRLSRGRELLKQKINQLEKRNTNERRSIGSLLQKSKV